MGGPVLERGRGRLLIAAAVALTILPACAPPAVVAEIKTRYPAASFVATTRGCELLRSATSRRFGEDLKGAVLWARQVVGTARLSMCEVTVDALTANDRVPVYRVIRGANGRRVEERLVPE